MADPLTIVCDTREQRPWHFSRAVRVVRATVPSGADYTVLGHEDCIGIERKGSLTELAGNFASKDRPRFLRSLERLARRRWCAVIIEASLPEMLCGAYRSQATPSSLLGSICAAMADTHVPFLFAGDTASAAELAERLLTKFHKRAVAALRSEAA